MTCVQPRKSIQFTLSTISLEFIYIYLLFCMLRKRGGPEGGLVAEFYTYCYFADFSNGKSQRNVSKHQQLISNFQTFFGMEGGGVLFPGITSLD